MKYFLTLVASIIISSTLFASPFFLPSIMRHESTSLEPYELVTIVNNSGDACGIKSGDKVLIDMDYTFSSTPTKQLDITEYTISINGSTTRSGNTYQMFTATTNRTADSGSIIITANAPYELKKVTFSHRGEQYTTSENYSSDRSVYTFTSTKVPTIGSSLIIHTSEVYAISVDAWVYANQGRTNDCTETTTLIQHPFGVQSLYLNNREYNKPMTWGAYLTIVGDSVKNWSIYSATNRVNISNGMRIEDGINFQQSVDFSYKNNGFFSMIFRDSIGSNTSILATENLDPYPCIVNFPSSNTTEIIWSTNGISGGIFVIECSTNYPTGWIPAIELITNIPPAIGYLSRTVRNPYGDTYTTTYWRVHNTNATIGTPILKTDLSFSAKNITLTEPRWNDSAMIFSWKTGGVGAPDLATLPVPYDAISTLGWADNEYVNFRTQMPHTLAPSNSNLYVEPHVHVLPLSTPPSNANRTRVQIIYAGAETGGTLYGPITNVVEIVLSSNVHTYAEFGRLGFTNFYPGISGKFYGTITRLAAGSSNFIGLIELDGDFHYPLDRIGSTYDETP